MFWLLISAALATCPSTGADLSGAIQQAHSYYELLDPDGFTHSTQEAWAVLGCLSEPISPALAVETHLLRVMEASVLKDVGSIDAAVRAVRTIAPDYTFSQNIAPTGSLIQTAVIRVQAEAQAQEESLEQPLPEGDWLIDGSPSDSAPLDRALVLQALDGGQVSHTTYIRTPDQLPPPPLVRPLSQRLGRAALVSGGVAAAGWLAGAGACFAHSGTSACLGQDGAGLDPALAGTDRDSRLRALNTGGMVVAGAGGAAAAGLTIGALVSKSW